MNLSSISKKYDNLFNNKKDFKEEVEKETQLFTFRILNEIEKEMELTKTTQTALAKKIGKSSPYLSNIFAGLKKPNIELLNAMSLALEKRIDVRVVSNIEVSRMDSTKRINKSNFYNDEVRMLKCVNDLSLDKLHNEIKNDEINARRYNLLENYG